ncbi:hypothetical protein [Candidatus Minimicrobia vallesae]|uniref:hypothetical protein n=1 Tax=Candidatus Minimicrobia vallesae TaxID=2841264 RepID=UPI001E46B7E7|nr:hypothetical protein [Candidatus Minimicrobia vallesae]
MAIFHYISVLVPTTLAVATPYVLKKNGFDSEQKYRWLLYVACLLFFISWYLPSPLIGCSGHWFCDAFCWRWVVYGTSCGRITGLGRLIGGRYVAGECASFGCLLSFWRWAALNELA